MWRLQCILDCLDCLRGRLKQRNLHTQHSILRIDLDVDGARWRVLPRTRCAFREIDLSLRVST